MQKRVVGAGMFVAAVVLSSLVASCGSAAPRAPLTVPGLSRYSNEVLAKRSPDGYGTALLPDPDADLETDRQFFAEFYNGLDPKMREGAVHDPALDLAANALAPTFDWSGKMPSKALQQWVAWRAGSSALVVKTCAGSRKPPRGRRGVHLEVPEWFTTSIRACAHALPPGQVSFGGVRYRYEGGPYLYQLMVIASHPGTLEPLPKRVNPGETVTFRTHLGEGYTHPVLYIDDPETGVKRVSMVRAGEDDGSYWITVSMPATPGRYYFEIRAREPTGESAQVGDSLGATVAWAPLFVGIPAEDHPDPAGTMGAVANGSNVDDTSQVILAMYNAERARFSLPPMTLEPTLSRLAAERAVRAVREPSAPPLDAGFEEQLSLSRLSPSGVSWDAETYDNLSESLMMSAHRPSRRYRVLDPGHLEIGIGALKVPADSPDAFRNRSYESFQRYEILARVPPALGR